MSGNFSVDSYRAGRTDPGALQNAPTAKAGPARATVTWARPAYNIAKGIRGPSATGPYTRFDHATWGDDQYTTGVSWAGGHNLGLA